MPHWDQYVSELPYSHKHDICKILDGSGDWRILGEELGYSTINLNNFGLRIQRLHGSPSYDLLTDYSCRNPTFREFHRKLLKLKLLYIADLLKEYVDPSNISKKSPNNNNLQQCSSSSESDDNQLDRDLPFPAKTNHKKKQQSKAKNKNDRGQQEYARIPAYERHQQETMQGREFHPARHNAEHPFTANPQCSEISSESTNDTVNAYSSPPPAYKTGSYIAYHQSGDNTQKLNTHDELAAQVQLMNFQSSTPHSSSSHMFCYEDLTKATYAFDGDFLINKLHRGNFGKMYHAKIAGTKYAVKLFLPQCSELDTLTVIQPEIECILRYQHPNLVTFHDFITHGTEICLVYEYMSGSSLANKLHSNGDGACLTEAQRYRILFDVSNGLQYLHNCDKSKSIAHGNIKSMNILLNEHLVAKISDFGQTHIAATAHHCNGKTDDYMFETMNTSVPYFPPEFKSKYRMSQNADVFAFGVVILECCTGELPWDSKREGSQLLTSYIKNHLDQSMAVNLSNLYHSLCDKSLAKLWNERLWGCLFLMGYKCIDDNELHRPSAPEVYEKIQEIYNASECLPGRGSVSSEMPVQKQLTANSQCLYNDGIVRQRVPIHAGHDYGQHKPTFSNINRNIEESQNSDKQFKPPYEDVMNKSLPYGLGINLDSSFEEDTSNSSTASDTNASDNMQQNEQIQFVKCIPGQYITKNNTTGGIEHQGHNKQLYNLDASFVNVDIAFPPQYYADDSNKSIRSSVGSTSSGSSYEKQGGKSDQTIEANAYNIEEKPWPSSMSSISSVDSQPDDPSSNSNSTVYLDTKAVRNCDKYGLYSKEKKCKSDPGPRVVTDLNLDVRNISLQRWTLSGPQVNSSSTNSEPIYGSIHFV